jgi:hypothetical protein
VAFFASFIACGIPRFMCVIFSLKVCICGLFCILLVNIGSAPCAFNKLILPIKKKKNLPVSQFTIGLKLLISTYLLISLSFFFFLIFFLLPAGSGILKFNECILIIWSFGGLGLNN